MKVFLLLYPVLCSAWKTAYVNPGLGRHGKMSHYWCSVYREWCSGAAQLNPMVVLTISWDWAACTAGGTTLFPTAGPCIHRVHRGRYGWFVVMIFLIITNWALYHPVCTQLQYSVTRPYLGQFAPDQRSKILHWSFQLGTKWHIALNKCMQLKDDNFTYQRTLISTYHPWRQYSYNCILKENVLV